MSALPQELPRLPEGFRQRLVSEVQQGGLGIAAAYDVLAPDGTKMPFQYAYRTGADGAFVMRGYFLDGLPDPMTWSELRVVWPEFLRSIR